MKEEGFLIRRNSKIDQYLSEGFVTKYDCEVANWIISLVFAKIVE